LTEGVLSFSFRLLDGGSILRLRAITDKSQSTLWQTDMHLTQRARVWMDLGRLAGRKVTLRWELWGPKGASSGAAEIDDVVLGSVSIQPTPTLALP
jgi:hypothetical protein